MKDKLFCLANKYSKGIAAAAAAAVVIVANKIGFEVPGEEVLAAAFVTLIVVLAPKNTEC